MCDVVWCGARDCMHFSQSKNVRLLNLYLASTFCSGPSIRAIWPPTSPMSDLSESWLKDLGRCPNLRQLQFYWAGSETFENASGLFTVKRLEKLQIDNFCATQIELLELFASNDKFLLKH